MSLKGVTPGGPRPAHRHAMRHDAHCHDVVTTAGNHQRQRWTYTDAFLQLDPLSGYSEPVVDVVRTPTRYLHKSPRRDPCHNVARKSDVVQGY